MQYLTTHANHRYYLDAGGCLSRRKRIARDKCGPVQVLDAGDLAGPVMQSVKADWGMTWQRIAKLVGYSDKCAVAKWGMARNAQTPSRRVRIIFYWYARCLELSERMIA